MLEIALMVVFVFALLAFKNWRQGFALCVLTALLQDPARKMMPDQPVYFVIFVGVVFGAAWLGALTARVPLAPGKMLGWQEHVGLPFTMFIAVVLLQASHSLASFRNPAMTGIGLLSYLAPIPAIALAYRFALSRGDVGLLRWMRFYVVVATLALATVYLEFSGFDWQALGEVGVGVRIFGQEGYYKGNAGIFRATEIAAWHAATVACFAFVLFWGRRFSPPKFLLAMAFIAFLVGIGALTGRRKMIIEIAIFISVYFCLFAWFRRGSGKMVVLTSLLGVVAYAAAVGMMAPDQGDESYASERVAKSERTRFSKYSERAQTVFQEVPKRVVDLGVMPVSWAIESSGWLGAGLGVGSQGAQHFGGQPNGAAEGGLGKLTVELGVPGLIVVFWMLVAFSRYVWHVLRMLSRTSPRHANLAFGLVAYILANVAAFSVATQAYGDLFVLLTLGWSFGFLVALPVLADAQLKPSMAVSKSVFDRVSHTEVAR